MISLNKIGGQSDTASASFNVSKTADIANLPTDGVPNCSTCIDWSTGDLYYFDGDESTWKKQAQGV